MEQATTRGKLYQTGKAKAQSLVARVGMTKQQRNQRPLKDNDKRATSVFKGVLAATTLLGAGAMMEKAAYADTQAATVTSAMQSEALADARLVNLTSTSLTSDDVSTSEQGSEATSFSASNSSSISQTLATNSLSSSDSPATPPDESVLTEESAIPTPTESSLNEPTVTEPTTVTEDNLTLVSSPLTEALAANLVQGG